MGEQEHRDRFVQLSSLYDPSRGAMLYALDATGRVWKLQDGRDQMWRLMPEGRHTGAEE